MSPSPPSGRALLLDRLREKLGADHVEDRAPHIRCRPGSTAEAAAALEAAAVGGVRTSCAAHPEALLHLDLSRLQELRIDEISLACRAGAGLTLAALQRSLRERGLSLGPLPAGSLRRALGAALAAPRPSEASPLLGRLRDRPLQLEAVLPDGREACLPRAAAPRRSAGPDLRHLLLGGRGRTGVITAAVLPVVRPGPARRFLGWMLPDGAAAAAALLEVLRRTGGAGPTDLQVASRELLAPLGDLPQGAAALLMRAEGPEALCEAQGALGAAACAGRPQLPEALCQAWLDPAPDAGPDGAGAPWPATERAFTAPTAEELGAAFDRSAGPRLLCGAHLHGVVLCAERPHAPVEAPAAARLFEQLCERIDPQRLLC